jgi:hypothetical protein
MRSALGRGYRARVADPLAANRPAAGQAGAGVQLSGKCCTSAELLSVASNTWQHTTNELATARAAAAHVSSPSV